MLYQILCLTGWLLLVAADAFGQSPNAMPQSPAKAQIHVRFHQLRLTPETLAELYLKHADQRFTAFNAGRLPATTELAASPISGNDSAASQSSRPSRVTTMVLNDDPAIALIEKNLADLPTGRLWSPSVILISGDEASLNEQVENPFVVDFKFRPSMAIPVMDVVKTGDEFEVSATLSPTAQQTELSVRWRRIELLSVQEDTLPGEGGLESQNVRVPVTQISEAQATRTLDSDQWLWIDPHYSLEPLAPAKGSSRFSWASMRRVSDEPSPDRLIILIKPKATGAHRGDQYDGAF